MHAQFSGYSSFALVTDPVGADLAGGKSLWAGAGKEGRCAFLIQAADGKHHILYLHPSDNELIHYPLDANQWLTDAQYFAFCDNADILFMASDSKIASIAVIGGSPVFREINCTSYTFPLATNRMQVAIFTYNEKTGEGKIYLRPFNVSTGLFTYKDNGVYGGFGRITAATTTFR